MARDSSKEPADEHLLSFPVRLLIHWLTNAIVLGVIAAVLSNVHVDNAGALLEAAAVFGALNLALKPFLAFVTFPLAVLTFGIARFFVSLLMLVITKSIVHGFHIHGFWTFVKATVLVWIVNLILDHVPGPWRLVSKKNRRRRRDSSRR